MKIIAVESHIVDGAFRNWVFVVVRTDDGSLGLGEATLEGREQAVVGAVADLSRRLLGADPRNIRKLVYSLSREGYWERGPVISSAIGGIEIALWDLMGRTLGASVAAMFGGPVRTEIPVYSNAWYFGATDPADLAERAASTIAQGFTALKFDPFGRADTSVGASELQLAVERVAAVRSAVGRGVGLMIEGHGRFSTHSAVRISHALSEFDPLFFEEPVRPHDYEALRHVAAQTSIPIATGERCYDFRECVAAVESGAVAVLQPDVIHVGGLTALFRIADFCADAQVLVAPHNASGPVATAATLQAAGCFPNLFMQEMFAPIDAAWKDRVVRPGPTIVDGTVKISMAPGLGVELDEAVAARHPFQPRDLNMMGGGSILELSVE